jgi:hypothetical protein
MANIKEQIRAEVERLRDEHEKATRACSGLNIIAMTHGGAQKVCDEILAFIDSLPDETVTLKGSDLLAGYDETYLQGKIGKASKHWAGVDVDKYMDEVRGREPDEHLIDDNKKIEEAAYLFSRDTPPGVCGQVDVINAFIAGAKWQKEHATAEVAHCINEERPQETDGGESVITFERTGGPYGDETSSYKVSSPATTVGEFIEQVLNNTPAWGEIVIRHDSRLVNRICVCAYNYGAVERKASNYDAYCAARIKSITASGAWSMMNYSIRVEDYDSLPAQSNEDFHKVYFGGDEQ